MYALLTFLPNLTLDIFSRTVFALNAFTSEITASTALEFAFFATAAFVLAISLFPSKFWALFSLSPRGSAFLQNKSEIQNVIFLRIGSGKVFENQSLDFVQIILES